MEQQIKGIVLSQLFLAISLIDAGAVKASDIAASLERHIAILEAEPSCEHMNLEPMKTLKDAMLMIAKEEDTDIFSSPWFIDFIGNA